MSGEATDNLLGTQVELTDSGAFLIWQGAVDDPPEGAGTLLLSKEGARWLANTLKAMLDDE